MNTVEARAKLLEKQLDERRRYLEMENIYTVEIISRGIKGSVHLRARNKVEAVTRGMDKILRGWRDKDGIEEIRVIEDSRNRELGAADYNKAMD